MASKERLYELWMLYYTKVSHGQANAPAARHLLPSEFNVDTNLAMSFNIVSHRAYVVIWQTYSP